MSRDSIVTASFIGRDICQAINAVTAAELDDSQEYELIIRKRRKKRSKDANAYFWEFLDKLAVKLNIGKKELYRELIRDIGGVSTTICVQNRAADALIEGWEHNGLGWFGDKTESRLDGCTNVILYFGSSSYDTAQMARLIDRLMFECDIVGIDTTDLKTKALLEVQDGQL